MFLFCMGSLLQCFRVRIRAKFFQPDLGPVRPPPLRHIVANMLINTNKSMIASHGFIQHFLFFVFETLLWFLLCFINCKHAAATERAAIFFSTILTWKNLCFTEFSAKILWNTRVAASDVFHMFTQSIKFF